MFDRLGTIRADHLRCQECDTRFLLDRVAALEAALERADSCAHPYVSAPDNVCITCGEVGSYVHKEPEIVTELRLRALAEPPEAES